MSVCQYVLNFFSKGTVKHTNQHDYVGSKNPCFVLCSPNVERCGPDQQRTNVRRYFGDKR